jgi:hypothetical protein
VFARFKFEICYILFSQASFFANSSLNLWTHGCVSQIQWVDSLIHDTQMSER